MRVTRQPDIREEIFRDYMERRIAGALVAEEQGVLSGIKRARELMLSLGLSFASAFADGESLKAEQEILRVTGNPVQIAWAEERLIGALSKYSGIATAARAALETVQKKYRVVSGGWKKMPFELKAPIRKAISDGGIDLRICEPPFIYLDKNYVRILGGVREAVQASLIFKCTIVVQIKGENRTVAEEAVEAAKAGARVIMVDTGNDDHLRAVGRALVESGLRAGVQIAFAGNIGLGDLEPLSQLDLDAVDIGYAILDAPSLRMRFDVVAIE
jgi:nicotinate-nucleotide pyrophosphorylase (carboxylating)